MIVSRMYYAIVIYIVCLLDASISNEIIHSNSRYVRQAATTEAATVEPTPEAATAEPTPEEPRECYNFKIIMGMSFRNYHSCCNISVPLTPTMTTSRPAACDKSFSDNDQVFDCTPSKMSYREQNITEYFHCAGCRGQTWAKNKCSSRWFWLGGKHSIQCWVTSECFKGACQSQEEKLQSGNEIPSDISFCGNGICEEVINENKRTCPLDCCAAENPKKCAISNNTCPDICCSEEHCCDVPPVSGWDWMDADKIWYIIGGVIVGVIVFINFLCCCCWCCLYSRCKRVTKRRNRRMIAADILKKSSVPIPMKDRPIEFVNSTGPRCASNCA